MNNKTIIFIHSFIHSSVRTLVRSSVDLFIRPNPSVLLLVRSVVRSFVPSFLRSSVHPSVCLSVRPFIHSFTHSFVLLAYSCVVRMSRISNRTIGGHQSTGLLSREKQFKFKTIHLLRKPTNNLITTLD